MVWQQSNRTVTTSGGLAGWAKGPKGPVWHDLQAGSAGGRGGGLGLEGGSMRGPGDGHGGIEIAIIDEHVGIGDLG